MRLSVGNRTVATATLKRPWGSMYTRKAFSIARGASSETRLPKPALMTWSRLTMPSPTATGSISMNTCLIRGSCQSICIRRRKSIRPSAPNAIPSCTTVATRIPIENA